MTARMSYIYQFKITLRLYRKPKIWRRIQVPEKYSFKDLHLAIQNAMGWQNYHLHQFEIINPKTGQKEMISMPDGMDTDFFFESIPVAEVKAKIAAYFLTPNKDKAIYEYDFGDGWRHEVMLEKILPAVAGTDYPQCTAGKRACPPEDCGGVRGYEDLLEIMDNPNHTEYEERMEWLRKFRPNFNPEVFDHRSVEFGDHNNMTARISNIYQFKITLRLYTKPKIWRRIQVPEKYSFKDLHLAIQNAMGWQNYHLHEFEIINPKTGQKEMISMPDGMEVNFFVERIPVAEVKAKIAAYFLTPKDKAIYEYDFGDGWRHEVMLEKILPAVAGTDYPQCTAGKRACPPEDCGGVRGYEDLLEIMDNPNHTEYEERMEWLRKFRPNFNPEVFDHRSVEFRSW